jgi:hypothetical protein
LAHLPWKHVAYQLCGLLSFAQNWPKTPGDADLQDSVMLPGYSNDDSVMVHPKVVGKYPKVCTYLHLDFLLEAPGSLVARRKLMSDAAFEDLIMDLASHRMGRDVLSQALLQLHHAQEQTKVTTMATPVAAKKVFLRTKLKALIARHTPKQTLQGGSISYFPPMTN